MGAIKHVVQNQASFVNFDRYLVGSQTVILGIDSEEDVLGMGTYQLQLHERKTLLLHDALYRLAVQCFFVSFISDISFLF